MLQRQKWIQYAKETWQVSSLNYQNQNIKKNLDLCQHEDSKIQKKGNLNHNKIKSHYEQVTTNDQIPKYIEKAGCILDEYHTS